MKDCQNFYTFSNLSHSEYRTYNVNNVIQMGNVWTQTIACSVPVGCSHNLNTRMFLYTIIVYFVHGIDVTGYQNLMY